MKTHKIISAPSKDDNPQDHVFLEVENNRFIEIANRPYEVTHKSIHDNFPNGLGNLISFAERYIRLQFPIRQTQIVR